MKMGRLVLLVGLGLLLAWPARASFRVMDASSWDLRDPCIQGATQAGWNRALQKRS